MFFLFPFFFFLEEQQQLNLLILLVRCDQRGLGGTRSTSLQHTSLVVSCARTLSIAKELRTAGARI